jgi:hypothetical protein
LPHRGLRDSDQQANRSRAAAARGARAKKPPVIELAPHPQRQARPPALASRGFAPFLAQQAAQASARRDDEAGNAKLERGLAAYQLAAGDEATLLGPVRPTDIRL